MIEWIRDRQPTEEDANEGLAVLVCCDRNNAIISLRWNLVEEFVCWAAYSLPPTPLTDMEKAQTEVDKSAFKVSSALAKLDSCPSLHENEYQQRLEQALEAKFLQGLARGRLEAASERATQ